ncbi:tripartite tricarboxylate transporter substrate binding protein [Hydrogenophaga sp.]|uniref:Bug family tripartite tricarboxylate transporter substrate binding protein n=1 Tax=Hydrogenophaga sp. TaxID=1904254 RepID=UPI00272223B8|nr:tripartite tricarboxylate transporter substrate binding protein [Hydrogenophaga sp.]MDO9437112.1 tripartite tricarboxylate transporter substrate binding protein [Hydrogenophaga sp.]
MRIFRTLALTLGMGAFAAAATLSAHAQGDAYPVKPIKLISGFAAGGSSDLITRAIAQSLGDQLGKSVVVENRAGAAGLIGLDAVTQAPPDGYTIGILANTTINSLHFQNKPLDAANRFATIGRFASSRILLAVNPSRIDVKTLPELIEYLRKNPGTTMTSAGHGGLGHLGLELLAQDQKLNILHVAYRGAGPALNDVVAGQVSGMIIEANAALPHIQSGKLRPIVTVSTERIPSLPDLPTALELGYKTLQIDSTFGIVVPPRTPQPIVDKLRSALKAAVESDAYADSQRKVGNARFFEDAPEYKVWLEKDFARWGAVIRDGNIKAQ